MTEATAKGGQRREHQALLVHGEFVMAAVEAKVQRDWPVADRLRMEDEPAACSRYLCTLIPLKDAFSLSERRSSAQCERNDRTSHSMSLICLGTKAQQIPWWQA